MRDTSRPGLHCERVKKNRSKLDPFEGEILELREGGRSLRAIATHLMQRHGVKVSYNAVFSFLNSREEQNRPGALFFSGLPEDIQQGLIKQMTALWTFGSTSLEGNTLTLGETVKVLELGLTINGKPLKDHEEAYGHAKAVDLILELIQKDKIEAQDLFDLHRCVMQKSAIDSLRPVGNWKRDFNGTTGVAGGKPVYMEYASPSDTPRLMARWIKAFNRKLLSAATRAKAINVYAWAHLSFVRIHPFFDGNGRIARLIANLPLLKCGHPPLLISLSRRAEYVDCLWAYENAVGVIKREDRLLPPDSSIAAFKALLRKEWEASMQIVDEAYAQLARRQSESGT